MANLLCRHTSVPTSVSCIHKSRVCDYALTPLRGTLVDTLIGKYPNLGRARV